MPRTKKVAEVKEAEVKEVETPVEAPVEAPVAEAKEAPKKKAVRKVTRKASAKKEEKKPEIKEFKWRKATIRDFELILSPIVTEKTQNLQTNHNTMVFKVKNDATADEVKDAVEAIFAVKVDKVNIVNVSRKAKRVGQYNGHVPGYKKAYVVINKEYNLGDIARQTQETK